MWKARHGGSGRAGDIDDALHAARLSGRAKRTYRAELATLPDGTYVTLDGTAWLVWDATLLAWSDGGYVSRRPRPVRLSVDVLTPEPAVAVLASGYVPAVNFL